MSKLFPPMALNLDREIKPDWNRHQAIKNLRGSYLCYKTVTDEMYDELWVAKQAITKHGKRKAGMVANGEQSWSAFLKECYGNSVSKRTIDNYLKRYEENGCSKPTGPLTLKVVAEDPRLEILNVKAVENHINFDISLPEFDKTYSQRIVA